MSIVIGSPSWIWRSVGTACGIEEFGPLATIDGNEVVCAPALEVLLDGQRDLLLGAPDPQLVLRQVHEAVVQDVDGRLEVGHLGACPW